MNELKATQNRDRYTILGHNFRNTLDQCAKCLLHNNNKVYLCYRYTYNYKLYHIFHCYNNYNQHRLCYRFIQQCNHQKHRYCLVPLVILAKQNNITFLLFKDYICTNDSPILDSSKGTMMAIQSH